MTTAVRFAVLAALFLIPFIPLYIANSLFFPFITGKHFAFRILVEVALVGWGLLMLVQPKYRPRFSWTLVLYGALVAWMFVANMLAVNPHKAFWSNYERMDGWVTLVHVFGFFLVAGAVLSADKLWRKWWLTFLGASAFVCLYGLLQIAGLFTIHQGGVRLDATMGNAAYLAVYLLFVVAVALWHAFESRGALRYALFALAGLQTMLLFMTATRGALLGAVAAIVIGAVLWMLSTSGKTRRYGIGILVGVVIAVGGLFMVRDATWIKEEPTLSRLSSITLADGSTRFSLWGMAMQGVADRPVFGWGQEGFNYVFNTYYTPTLYAQEPWFDRAHNIYIDWLIAGGIPAFLLFVSLLGMSAVALYRKGTRTERIFLIAALSAYAFQGLFVFDSLFSYVPLAALLAMAHSVSSRPISRIESAPTVSENTFQTVGIPVAVVAGAVLIWSVNVPAIQAGGDLVRALSGSSDPRVSLATFETALARGSFGNQEIREQLVTYAGMVVNQTTIPTETKIAVASAAVAEMGKQVEKVPEDARLRMQYATAYRTLGDFESAMREIRAGQALSPKKQNLILEEGIISLQAKNYPAARAAFVRAYELDPSFDTLVPYVAAGEILVGNKNAAKELLYERFQTPIIDSTIIVLAYYELKDYQEVLPILESRIADTAEPTPFLQLASVYVEAGQKEEARRVLRILMERRPDIASQVMQFMTEIGV